MTTEKQRVIKRRRQRRERIHKLKEKFEKTNDLRERDRLLDLIRRRNPWFMWEEE